VKLVPVATVTVIPNPVNNLQVTQTVQFQAILRDANGNVLVGRPVSWAVSDTSKASITAAGFLTALAPGSVTVTATAEGVSGTSAVTIIP
jgi:uncharacterized protein YjdB